MGLMHGRFVALDGGGRSVMFLGMWGAGRTLDMGSAGLRSDGIKASSMLCLREKRSLRGLARSVFFVESREACRDRFRFLIQAGRRQRHRRTRRDGPGGC